jgi:hypothetical protein
VMAVPKSAAAGHSIYGLSWVYKYKMVDGAAKEKARLVFNNTSGPTVWTENSFADAVKPMHWKTLIHLGLLDGAWIGRRDIGSAHQTTRRDPNGVTCFSHGAPGVPFFVDGPNGKEEGYLQWNNMINGMPPAGNAFSGDLQSHLRKHGMMTTMQDANVCVWVGPVGSGSYLRVGTNVDDMLVIAKPQKLVEAFDAHVRTRWTMTEASLDGWLNIQFYARGDARTVTMVMDVRLTEIMHEHLPLEMELATAAYPETPNHPRLGELTLGDGSYSEALGKQAGRLQAQLIYQVVMIYYWAQYPIFYAARFGSKPTALYLECLLYALRGIYGARHIGLTLGGSETEDRVHGSTRIAGLHADAGHAQPGPSCGGHTIEIGSATVHAMSGQHQATTLGTTDSETYELSRGVAAILGMRAFLSEIGVPQTKPSLCNSDNAGTVLKAASATSDKRSLYMKRRSAFIQEAQMQGEIDVGHIDTADNRSDILTKALAAKLFKRHRDTIMNVSRSALNVHSAISKTARALRRHGR